jgi:hypothetical protein
MAKRQLTKEDAFQILWNNGFYNGWKKILDEFQPEADEAAEYKAYLFKKLLEKIQEAKSELRHLELSVQRLENACRGGTRKNPAFALSGMDSNAQGLAGEMQTFSGWVASILETNLTLLHYIINPQTAGGRLKDLTDAFARLGHLRAKERKLWASDPDPFIFITRVN